MSENEKKVPTVVVKRLPRYYRYLGELLKQDIKRISSNGDILGLNDGDTTVIVGAGNLGRALARHDTFEKRGFKLVGIFDNDINIIGTKINGIEVMSIDKLEEFLNSHRVDIGILTVPKAAVMKTAEKLVNCGVKGLMNFSYTELKFDKDVAVENVHLSDPLMTLSYKIKQNQN